MACSDKGGGCGGGGGWYKHKTYIWLHASPWPWPSPGYTSVRLWWNAGISPSHSLAIPCYPSHSVNCIFFFFFFFSFCAGLKSGEHCSILRLFQNPGWEEARGRWLLPLLLYAEQSQVIMLTLQELFRNQISVSERKGETNRTMHGRGNTLWHLQQGVVKPTCDRRKKKEKHVM